MRNYKFFYKYTCFFCLIIILTSCGKSVESYVKEAIDAMNEGEYDKAYSIVDIMNAKKKSEYSSVAFELNSKIVNNEIASLFEDKDPFLSVKINKIIKERFNLKENGYFGSEEEAILSQINSALSNAIELAFAINNLDLVENLAQEYIKYNSPVSDFRNKTKKTFYTNIFNKILKFNSANVPEIINRILVTYPIRQSRKEGVVEKYSWNYYFMDDTREYNDICNYLFNSSLTRERYDIAEILIELFKEDPVITEGSAKGKWIKGEKVDEDHIYVQYNWNSKNTALKKLNEAKNKIK